MSKSVSVVGIDEINELLSEIMPKHARNLSRSFIHGIASRVAKEAKKNAPKDTGTLKKSIKAKRRRSPPDKPVSEVIVTRDSKADGFYWRFVEYGTAGKNPQPARPFLEPAKQTIAGNIEQVAEEEFKNKLAKTIAREKKKAAKK